MQDRIAGLKLPGRLPCPLHQRLVHPEHTSTASTLDHFQIDLKLAKIEAFVRSSYINRTIYHAGYFLNQTVLGRSFPSIRTNTGARIPTYVDSARQKESELPFPGGRGININHRLLETVAVGTGQYM